MLEETCPVPKYFQISRAIISEIQKGHLPPGSPVLSENEIIEKYSVSNTTARKALLELERAGWVERRRGQGTFVKTKPVVRNIERIFGFTKNMIEAGRAPATKLIGFHLREGNHSQVINGREFVLKGPFCEIERIRYADEIPMMKETRVISLQLCPDIHKKKLEGSLYEIFEKDYGIHLVEIKQIVSAILLEGERLKPFNVTTPLAAFCVQGASFASKDIIVEMEDSTYRGDMYRFSANAVAEPLER